MAPDQEAKYIQNLQFLGLTLNQARVYAALAKFENATAKTLSNVSGLAACDIYRVIPELQELGLIEVLVATPKMFRSTPPEDAMKILLKQKEEEIGKMQVKAKEFLAEINIQKSPEHSDLTQIALIPCGERAAQFGMPKLSNTKEQLDAIQTNELFHRFIQNTSKEIVKLLKRNVKLRFLLENTMTIERPDKDLAKMLKNPNFKVRFAKTKINACILLHDNAEAFISTSLDAVHTPSYWTSNPCMVSVARGYFELEWREALEKQTY